MDLKYPRESLLNKEEKMDRIFRKLGIISMIAHQRPSAVRYVESIRIKLDRKGYFRGYEQKLKTLISQILNNSSLDHQITDVAKEIHDRL